MNLKMKILFKFGLFWSQLCAFSFLYKGFHLYLLLIDLFYLPFKVFLPRLTIIYNEQKDLIILWYILIGDNKE